MRTQDVEVSCSNACRQVRGQAAVYTDHMHSRRDRWRPGGGLGQAGMVIEGSFEGMVLPESSSTWGRRTFIVV